MLSAKENGRKQKYLNELIHYSKTIRRVLVDPSCLSSIFTHSSPKLNVAVEGISKPSKLHMNLISVLLKNMKYGTYQDHQISPDMIPESVYPFFAPFFSENIHYSIMSMDVIVWELGVSVIKVNKLIEEVYGMSVKFKYFPQELVVDVFDRAIINNNLDDVVVAVEFDSGFIGFLGRVLEDGLCKKRAGSGVSLRVVPKGV